MERTGLWNNSGEEHKVLARGQGSSVSHLPAAALWQPRRWPVDYERKNKVTNTREAKVQPGADNSNSFTEWHNPHIIYLPLQVTFSKPKIMPQALDPNSFPGSKREEQREREQCSGPGGQEGLV